MSGLKRLLMAAMLMLTIFWFAYYFIASQVVSAVFHKNILCTSVGTNSTKVQKCYDVPNKIGFGTPSELYEPLEKQILSENVTASSFLFFSHVAIALVVFLLGVLLRRLSSLNSVDGAIYPVVSYEADVNMFSPEKGGRQVPFFSNYRPNILVSGEAVPAEFILTNKEMVSPGETAKIIIKTHNSRSLSLDQEFEIQDGVHVVGSGTITKVL